MQLLASALLTKGDLGAEVVPRLNIVRNQLVCCERLQATGKCCLHSHRSMHDQSRKRSAPSSRSPLMKAHLSERLLQIIVCPWQVRDLIAEKQMGAITLCHFEKMSDGLLPTRTQRARLLLHMHQDQQKTKLAFFFKHFILLPQDVGDLMDPSIDTLERFPIGPCCLYPLFQKFLQLFKRFREPLFSATRSMEALI